MEWGEFKAKALFGIQNTLSFNAECLVDGVEYDYVTRTSNNQGILRSTGFVNKENINPAGCWSLGLLQMDFFYREKPWYAGQFVRKVIPKFSVTKALSLFFTAVLNMQKEKLLSVLVRDVDNTFLNLMIKLPVKDGKIDFDFIENFIAELEAQKIAELEAYLSVTGLKDTRLSLEEEQALSVFPLLHWGKYQIGDLFSVNSYKKRFDANKVDVRKTGKYPYIVRTSINNGQKGYIDENADFLNEGNTISFGQDTATMFYQEKPYFTGDKIKVLKAKTPEFDKTNAHFIITAMQQPFKVFSWGSSSFNVNIIEAQEIYLPVKDGKIDFDFIKNFIFAIQKLVIKDVVAYADSKISATKQIAGSHN